MAKERVNISRSFNCDSEALFAALCEHESLGRAFAPMAKFRRLRDGVEGRNAEGSSRKITILGMFWFVETYTRVVPGARIEYVASGPIPIKNHLSAMTITPRPGGCSLQYTSCYDGKFPLLHLFVGPGLSLAMRIAFYRLSKRLNAQ